MTIYSDTVGNYFLGNLDLETPTANTTFHPTGGVDFSALSAELGTLATNAGLQWRDVQVNSPPSTERLIYFGASIDTINDRYAFNIQPSSSTNSIYALSTIMWNNSGAPGVALSGTNLINYTGNSKGSTIGDYIRFWVDTVNGTARYAVCANSQSMSVFGYNLGLVTGIEKLCWGFYHAGLLTDINPVLGYTSIIDTSVIITSSMLLGSNLSNANGIYPSSGAAVIQDNLLHVALYNTGSRKYATTNGSAIYDFIFSNGTQTRKLQATDLVVYDGSTYVGRVQNMLIADGFFIPGVPIRLKSTLKPDSGSNLWIPVGKFAGRTALARFYSSTMPGLPLPD